jgi:ADP-ribose pyrophosphatase YjhB (NUDIX family)
MSARHIVDQLTEAVDETNLCVVLRPGEDGMEALIVYDEQDRPSIPGGHAKGDESHAQAAKREVKEETDLDVEPQQLFWARHVARGPGRHTNLFYATVGEFEEGKPGGGDVTRLNWAPVTNLGELNGTDRLAIHIAANRVHSPQAIVDDTVELGEALGYAVGTVLAPPPEVPGLYVRLGGAASDEFALKLKAWAESLSWPVTLVSSRLCESSKDALARASKNRRLTPMLEAIVLVADTLWRYESEISPALAAGHIVIETGPMVIDPEHLKKRGLPSDLLNEVASRVRLPKLYFGVGESFNLAMLQIIQDGIEKLQTPDTDNPEHYLNRLKTAIQCPKCKETHIAAHAIGPQQGFLDPTAACSHCGHRDVRSAFYRRIDIE